VEAEAQAAAPSPHGAVRRQGPGRWERDPGDLSFPVARLLPASVRTKGNRLLNLQFWLWGQDIRRPAGSLLAAFGFERSAPPPGETGSNAWTAPLPDGGRITLWGFGLAAEPAAGGVCYVSRFRFEPLLPARSGDFSGVWEPPQLAPLTAPPPGPDRAAAVAAFLLAVRWMAEYERRLIAIAGPAWRHDCLQRWGRSLPAGPDIAAAWAGMAEVCAVRLRCPSSPAPVR
jgi:hypothetical protein